VPTLEVNNKGAQYDCRPNSRRELFICFTWIALQGFGGAAPVAQRELVEKKRWLSPQGFLEDWTVAQIMPGPNVVNLSLILGDRHFGISGAIAALAGMTILPLLLILVVAVAYNEYAHYDLVERTLKGMGAVAAGLIIGTGFKLLSSLKSNPIGFPASFILIVVTFVAIALFRWPLLWVLLATGIPSFIWASTRLARRERVERT